MIKLNHMEFLMSDTVSGSEDNQEQKKIGVSESEFHMWRALFAMVHGDGIVTNEERDFMWNTIEENNFSDHQLYTLKQEMSDPAKIDLMFRLITEPKDRTRFFELARVLCWCDGDFDEQEQMIISNLKRIHVKTVNFEEIIGEVHFELEQSKPRVQEYAKEETPEKKSLFKKLFSRAD